MDKCRIFVWKRNTLINGGINMNIKLIGTIVIVFAIVIGLVIAFGMNVFAGEKWVSTWGDEDDSEWGQEIILEYADGTLQTLKPLFDNKALAVTHEGNTVVGVYYRLSGKASATGYDSVSVRLKQMDLRMEAKQGSSLEHGVTIDLYGEWSNDQNLPLDNAWHLLGQYHFSTLNNDPTGIAYDLSPGTYTISFRALGTLTYSVDGGSWVSATLPGTISIDVIVQSDNSLTIYFGAGYEFH